jgi:cystathionine beta-lyase/cystathionine gamma-synthase
MQAATKYIGGHSDIMFGTVSANAKAWPQLAEGIKLLGTCAGPDDVYLALRGLRTLSVRLAQHGKSGLEMARWLANRPEVARVLHPALESDPGHAIWKRDFTGASGLFSIVLKPAPQQAVDALLDTVKLFGMGYSWGGFELVMPSIATSIGYPRTDGRRADHTAAHAARDEGSGFRGRSQRGFFARHTAEKEWRPGESWSSRKLRDIASAASGAHNPTWRPRRDTESV